MDSRASNEALTWPPLANRLSVSEAKRLLFEAAPLEETISAFRNADGTLTARRNSPNSSLYRKSIFDDFGKVCASIGVVPRWRYQPDVTDYVDGESNDDVYTISWRDLQQLAELFGFPAPSVGRSATSTPPPAKRVPAQLAQEENVLAALSSCGYDPLSIPKAPSGLKSPAKEAARKHVSYSHDVFEKTWKRLRSDGRIKDAD